MSMTACTLSISLEGRTTRRPQLTKDKNRRQRVYSPYSIEQRLPFCRFTLSWHMSNHQAKRSVTFREGSGSGMQTYKKSGASWIVFKNQDSFAISLGAWTAVPLVVSEGHLLYLLVIVLDCDVQLAFHIQ
jgi:hypothetical protein